MDCRQVAENLLLFGDGALSPEDTESLRQHLHLCPPCITLFESYEQLVEVLHRLQPVKMPPDFLSRMKQKLKDRGTEA